MLLEKPKRRTGIALNAVKSLRVLKQLKQLLFVRVLALAKTANLLHQRGWRLLGKLGNLIGANLDISKAMKRREAWKYTELEERLQGYPHEFECKIGNYIFDLVLSCSMVAVEFDGPDHRNEKQRISDTKKDQAAKALGYTVVRKEVKRAAVIPSCVLDMIVP